MGQSGNIPIKSNIPKSNFDVFDITEVYSLIIQNIRKIHLLHFSIQRLWGKSLEISTNFFMGSLFAKFDWLVPMTWGYRPYFIWVSDIFFLGTMIVFHF